MSFCDEHGTADYCGECVYGPEIERLTAERDAARAEARELREENEAGAKMLAQYIDQTDETMRLVWELRAGLARVKTLSATWREQAQALAEQQEAECDPDIASVLEATGDQLETCAEELDAAFSPAPEPILSTCPVCGDPDDHEHDSMAAPAPELPLMAPATAARVLNDEAQRPLGRRYRVTDTDEHGLPVIERTADMPEGATHKITWLNDGMVDFTDSTPIALEANRSGGMSERIEDYRPAAQEGGDASD